MSGKEESEEAGDLPVAGPVGRPHGAADAFFGRRKAKPLKPAQQVLFETMLPRLVLDLQQPAPQDLRTLFPRPVSQIRLEIGFGGGEHLAHEAGRFPQTGFIGAEPFINGMGKMLSLIEGRSLDNIRLHHEDAVPLLDWLPAGSISRVDLLYPDPWHKSRHWKRRFVSADNLDRIARVLQPQGEFRFASDIAHYVRWTLRHCHEHAQFELAPASAADPSTPWEGWTRTRYEAKAIREGRPPAYLVFVRSPG